ncbi:MAG: hypothetical protein VX278_17525 [Myxococcota bacterium]|nr:hypothetical protein [Myxococcota bacterium]
MLFWILGCGASDMDISMDFGTPEPLVSSCERQPPIEEERLSREYYLGAKVFTLMPDYQTLKSTSDLKEIGMNTASIVFTIPFDDDGAIRYPYSSLGLEFIDVDDHLCQVGNLIYDLKRDGMDVFISAEPHYYDKDRWMELNPDWSGGPPKLTSFDDPEIISSFTQNVLPIMDKFARMVERYKVDFAAPISEPDKYFGTEPTNAFMASVLPSFESFEGKLLWQVYGGEFLEPNWEELQYRYDFRGYDVMGMAVLGCDSPRENWDNYIQTLSGWAQDDGVPEIFHAEFGCVQVPDSEENAQENLHHWFDMSDEYTNALIVLDAPQRSEESQGIKGTWLEDWIREIAVEKGLLPNTD